MFHFRFLVAANAIAAYGTFLNMVALSLFAYQVTGSALHTGLFMALQLGAGFATGFGAGAVTSRYSRKLVIVWSGVAQAAAMGLLLVTPAGGVRPVLYVTAVITGVAGTLSAVALRSAVPVIVGSRHRVRANGLLVAGRSVAMIAGFASAGVIISVFDYVAVFTVNAGVFLLAAGIVAMLPIRTNAEPTPEEAHPPLLAAHRTAISYLRLNPVPAGLIVIHTFIGLASASAHVAIPVHSSAFDAASPEAFMTRFWTVWAIGNIVIQLAVQRHVKRGNPIGEKVFAVAACTMSLASVGVFVDAPLAVTMVAAFVTGAASGTAETAYQSRLQETPDSHRGYLFGLSATSESMSFGVGMVAAALLLDRVAPVAVVGSMSIVAVTAVAVFVVLVRRRGGTTAMAPSLVGERT